MSDTTIDAELIRPYRETEYRVHGHQHLTLKIDVPSQGLATLHRQHGCRDSAFITACNPFSAKTSDEENARRQALLAQELNRRGLVFFSGTGQHPSNKWPGEPSFLALGLSLADAKAMGEQFQQNAIVWCGADAVPQLILLR